MEINLKGKAIIVTQAGKLKIGDLRLEYKIGNWKMGMQNSKIKLEIGNRKREIRKSKMEIPILSIFL